VGLLNRNYSLGPEECSANVSLAELRALLFDDRFGAEEQQQIAAHVSAGCQCCDRRMAFLYWTEPKLKLEAREAIEAVANRVQVRRIEENTEDIRDAQALQSELGTPGELASSEKVEQMRIAFLEKLNTVLSADNPAVADYFNRRLQELKPTLVWLQFLLRFPALTICPITCRRAWSTSLSIVRASSSMNGSRAYSVKARIRWKDSSKHRRVDRETKGMAAAADISDESIHTRSVTLSSEKFRVIAKLDLIDSH
jgi:hypothetical protein